MATKLNETSIIEQHVEKGVLGVAVLVLLYVVFNWVPSSPRKIGPNGLKPDEIDASIKAESIRVQENNNNGAKVDPNEEKVDYEKLAENLSMAAPLKHKEIVQFCPPGPPDEEIIIDVEPITVTLEQVAGVISAPSKPRVSGNLELPRMEKLADMPTVHLAAVFNRSKLATEWQKLLGATKEVNVNITVIAVEAEIRELQADGTWSEPRAVEGFKLDPLDSSGKVYLDEDDKPLSVPTIVKYDGKNKEEVLDSIEEVGKLFWQEYILQPPYPQIYLSTGEWGTWQVNLPENEVSATVKSGTIRKTWHKPGDKVVPPIGVPPTKDKPRDRTPPTRTPPTDPRYKTPPDGQPRPPSFDPRGSAARNAHNTLALLQNAPIMDVRDGEKEKEGETVELKVVPIPSIEDQMQNGKLLILVHDQSIESSKVYQYRVRLVLLNPLYTHEADITEGHEKDAFVSTVKTPFSEWSRQVTVPKATEFFITGKNANYGTVRITVFTRALGQWVSEGFTVKVGQEIGGVQRIPVMNPDTGKIEQRKVDFSTGAVITDLDFAAKVPRGAGERATVEMLFIDDSGHLGSRIELLDSESSRLKQLKQEVERAKTAAAGG